MVDAQQRSSGASLQRIEYRAIPLKTIYGKMTWPYAANSAFSYPIYVRTTPGTLKLLNLFLGLPSKGWVLCNVTLRTLNYSTFHPVGR